MLPLPDAVDCSSSPDGVYGTACANSFVYCSNGRAHTAYCPAGLVFNVRISQCDFPSPECGIANAPTYVPTLTTPAIASNAPTTSRHSPEGISFRSSVHSVISRASCSAEFVTDDFCSEVIPCRNGNAALPASSENFSIC